MANEAHLINITSMNAHIIVQTLQWWVRIPLEAWMSVCDYSVFVFCVGSGHATG
jgi:hypothetical protein